VRLAETAGMGLAASSPDGIMLFANATNTKQAP
jgi:hypothetical protein